MLGHAINREPLSSQTVTGTALILAALLTHEIFDRIRFYPLKQAKRS
jgi:hypothetical protein